MVTMMVGMKALLVPSKRAFSLSLAKADVAPKTAQCPMGHQQREILNLWSLIFAPFFGWARELPELELLERANKNKGYPVEFEFQIDTELLLSISMSHAIFRTLAYAKTCSLLIWNSNLSWGCILSGNPNRESVCYTGFLPFGKETGSKNCFSWNLYLFWIWVGFSPLLVFIEHAMSSIDKLILWKRK